MPLFMDFHELDELSDETINILKKGHMLDLATQARHNVLYKNYYLSVPSKKVFCVMEGPNKESCEAVHREAHGLTACNIVQVSPKDYDLIMGNEICNPDGLHVSSNGVIDPGSRVLLLINSTTHLLSDQFDKKKKDKLLATYSNEVRQALSRYGGREVQSGLTETFYAFTSYRDAIQCGFNLQLRIEKLNDKLASSKIRFETTIVINAGDPVTKSAAFFGDAMLLARRMAHLANDGAIVLSSHIAEYVKPDRKMGGNLIVKVTGMNDERFINRIMDVLEKHLQDEKFDVNKLSKQVGISRPQLYRRIHALYGKSPNQLINELRLKEAIKLLNNRYGNIAEVAFQVGYSNPSYFAKCFKSRFGVLPSKYCTTL